MVNETHSIAESARSRLTTSYGDFDVAVFVDDLRHEHVALSIGAWTTDEPVLVRIHGECITGEVFHSLQCDCKEELDRAFEMVAAKGKGIIVYLRQEGRGIGLTNKIRAYELQRQGYDTVDANVALGLLVDGRDYHCAGDILHTFGVRRMRLLTNNPAKVRSFVEQGFLVERVSLEIPPNDYNRGYLKTKKEKMGHLLEHV